MRSQEMMREVSDLFTLSAEPYYLPLVEATDRSSTANSSESSSSSHSIPDVESRSLLQSYCQSDMKELELDPTTPQAQVAILRRKRNLEYVTL